MNAQSGEAPRHTTSQRPTRKWLGFAVPLAISYGVGLWAIAAAGEAFVRATRGPIGLRDRGSLRRILPERVNGTAAYALAPVFATAEWNAIRAGGLDMEVYRPFDVTLSLKLIRRQAKGVRVSPGFLPLVGASLTSGRFLVSDDGAAALLSERLARELFGDAKAATGSALRINGRGAIIVGVLGRNFLGIDDEAEDVWQLLDATLTPLSVEEFALSGVLRVANRSAALAATERAARVLAMAGAQVRSVRLASLSDDRVGGAGLARRTLPFVLLLCGAVVALALANCWLFVISWNMMRTADLRMRYLLGASPRRLAVSAAAMPVALLAITTLVVALLEPTASQSLASFVAGIHHRQVSTPTSMKVVALSALLLCAVTAVLAAQRNLRRELFTWRATVVGARSRARGLLVGTYIGVVCAIADATVPIVAANHAAARVRPGFNAVGVVVASVALDQRAQVTRENAIRSAVDALYRLPNVTAAGSSTSAPFRAVSTTTVARGAGNIQPISAHLYETTGDLIGALGIQASVGTLRALAQPSDGVVVTQALASRWNAKVGDCVYVTGDVCSPLLAVASNLNSIALGEPPFPTVFVGMQMIPANGRVYFLVRMAHKATAIDLTAVENAVANALPGASARAESVEEIIHEQAALLGAMQAICGALFGLAGLLALIGIHATLHIGVNSRRHELGIRGAIGATRSQLVGAVLAESAHPAAIAAAIGIGVGVLAARALEALIVGAVAVSTWSQLWVGFAMPVLVMAASSWSAVWATKVEPAVLLRDANARTV